MVNTVVPNSTPAAQVNGHIGSPFQEAAAITQANNERLATLTKIGGKKTRSKKDKMKRKTKKRRHHIKMRGGENVVQVHQLPSHSLIRTNIVPSPAETYSKLTAINNQTIENSTTDKVTLAQTGGQKHFVYRKKTKKINKNRKTKKIHK